ncbi:unnamed protein product [Caenorhabditis nigoni]|uniref:F-box domain-containing protein n=1 Tax=Caenorhabditis nigoni TaxID=1611254 RepID=A0A2G5VSK0_9PELO|nr:hypothetical protein B9Z55_003827 [Caenorhabditis nigoni]
MVKFLSLPYLVKDLVFKEMEPRELLLLSLCSKRVQKSIKQQFRIEPNKGFRITCGNNSPESYKIYRYQDVDEKRLELIVDHKENDKKVINWKYVNSLDNLDLLKEFKFLNDLNVKKMFDIELKSGFIFEINGLRCRCSISFDPESGIPTLYFEKNMMKKWPMELHKYCVDLFRTNSDLEMIMNLNDSSDLHEPQTIKDLYLHTSFENLNPKIADEVFEKAIVQNSLTLIKQDLEGYVSDDSKFWKIPNVLVRSKGWVHTRDLFRFTGKNAYFFTMSGPRSITQDMNAFLKHWLSSDNTTLETIIVCGYFSSTEDLFDGIQTSRWDPEKRPARYVSNTPFKRSLSYTAAGSVFLPGLNFGFDYLDCTNAIDIVRESDGLIASVKRRDSIFFMFVWHSKLL